MGGNLILICAKKWAEAHLIIQIFMETFWKLNTSELQNIFKSRDASHILFPIYCHLNI